MARTKFYIFLLQLSWTVSLVAAIQRADLFPYGTEQGDLTLAEGDDETSKVLKLTRPLYFYEAQFSELYVATNGIISAQDLPMEKQYVDDGLPTDFPVIAPFMADLDTSGGRGRIHYRLTEAPGVLTRVGREVRRGFPDAGFTPTHAVVATWEGVAAYEEASRAAAPSDRVNTFQVVVGYDESDSYALFLYPESGLQFYGTRPKESYNVEVELPARAGFSRGEVAFYFFSRTEGPHYSLTSNEQSVKNLYQMGNTGVPGVWLFHIGNRYSFENIVPAAVSGVLSTAPSRGQHEDSPTTEYPEEEYPEEDEAEEDYPLTEEPDLQQPDSSHNVASLPGQARLQPYGGDVPLNSDPQNAANPPPRPPGSGPGDRPQHQPRLPSPETGSLPQAQPPQSPESYAQTPPRGGQSAVKVSPGREQGGGLESLPLSPNAHVVDVEEDHVDFDTGIIHYSTDTKETCARFQQQCSQNAVCSDYATGYCCHCRAGFYGNGRHCLPDGAPHRVNGKVSGTVGVGATQVDLGDIDLHAYVVVGDGRAYTAVSEVPEPAGWALMPVAPLGELFGWLFALELPGSQAGFKITGAEFTRYAEVTFYPGNQRLSIVQTSRGLDENNYLTVGTRLRGNLPLIPPGSTVQMEPFKEIFQFYPSVVTSTSVREYSVVSAERGAEAFSLHTRQNITYRDCRHDNARGPETLQLMVERVFVMYVEEERILRYAITNKIGPVGVEPTEPELVNPCYSGTHDCDTTAQCLPGEGQTYQCKCATGYRGDGRNCYDVDECEEGRGSCGAHARCVNLPGGHRCQCQPGYEFGFDGRTCLDINECLTQRCHADATCFNSLGSFECQCNPGFQGDGVRCLPRGDQRPQTQCEQHRASLQGNRGHDQDQPQLGAFVPQCDEQGQYRSLQCHGSTGHCWCVDNRGQERSGTRTPPGTPPTNCDQPERPERPQTQCEQHVSRAQQSSSDGFPVVGAFVPQCDEQGQYRSLQCHGSTGHCWCVDNRGQERSGTRTPPGTPPTNCDQPVDVAPTRRTESVCERWRASLIDHYGGNPAPHHYLPQCDYDGHFNPVQCYGDSSYCWCVDQDGREVEGTRSHDVVKPACVPSVAPPTVRPLPRPDVTPPTAGSTLLYAQGQQIGALPLNGSRMDMKHSRTLLALHGSIVVGLDYDCRERRVYWTDLAGRTISRASMEQGALPETLINTDLTSPEGLAVDSLRRTMFWVDSKPDKIERANLDGSERTVLFNTDLVNPRAIIVDSSTGTLYWTDWNREAPKIESSTVEGHNRRVLVQEGIGLPNALTYDPTSRQVCWADAGTKRLECVSPDGSGRRVIHSNLNYPFSMVYYAGHFYYTDWRRDGVLAVSRDSSLTTDEFLPDQRSHLYGIAVATSQCL